MLELIPTSKYKKDFKRIALSGRYKVDDLDAVLEFLESDIVLPEKYYDHTLKGEYEGFRECHIRPDWLLIYKKTDAKIFLIRMGSHSELF